VCDHRKLPVHTAAAAAGQMCMYRVGWVNICASAPFQVLTSNENASTTLGWSSQLVVGVLGHALQFSFSFCCIPSYNNTEMNRYWHNAAQVLYKILNEDIDISSADDSDDEPDFIKSDVDKLYSAGDVDY